MGSSARLARVVEAMEQGQPQSVVFLGGSVTHGHGASRRGSCEFTGIGCRVQLLQPLAHAHSPVCGCCQQLAPNTHPNWGGQPPSLCRLT